MKAKTDRFREVWAKLDPSATGKINREDLSKLLFSVGKDLGWKESYKKSQER
jgi:Ca2+-binding EF-hand superfamily protein